MFYFIRREGINVLKQEYVIFLSVLSHSPDIFFCVFLSIPLSLSVFLSLSLSQTRLFLSHCLGFFFAG